jgi:hypothetical protein
MISDITRPNRSRSAGVPRRFERSSTPFLPRDRTVNLPAITQGVGILRIGERDEQNPPASISPNLWRATSYGSRADLVRMGFATAGEAGAGTASLRVSFLLPPWCLICASGGSEAITSR